MRYLFLIIPLLSFNSIAFSQDSISVRTEIDTFSQSNYEGQFDYVFARKEPKKQLFKLGLLALVSNGHAELLSYERKISKDVSLHFSLNRLYSSGLTGIRNVGTGFQEYDSTFYNSTPLFSFSFEPRWYFNMKKDILNGLVANNFHGSYVGFRTSYELKPSFSFNFDSLDGSFSFRNRTNQYIANEVCFGLQRRILKRQYIDFSVGTGVRTRIKTRRPTDEDAVQWIFNYRLAYGLILNKKSPKTIDNGAKCEALRCFEEERSMWKIGLTNLVSELNERLLTGSLVLAYEQKIPKTFFSVETSLEIGGNINAKKSYVSKNDNKYAFGIGIMPRHYYKMKKKIARGESADNLSGVYWGVRFDYITAQKLDNLKVQSTGATLLWGSQQRVLDHLNFDWWVGYQETQEKANDDRTAFSRGLALNFSLNLAF